MQLPHCPKCNSEYTYQDNALFICPECAHEWSDSTPAEDQDALIVKDANGNLLADGDAVTVIKDLKVKGSSSMLKIGTKVKNIRLVEGDHNIDCKIDGFGPMKLKSEFVKRTDSRRPCSVMTRRALRPAAFFLSSLNSADGAQIDQR